MEAENGKVVMRILQERSVALALVDLVMPEEEGLETIPKIKSRFPGTKIIAISGAYGGAFLTAAKALGASEVLAKPIAPQTLLGTVRQVLGD